jgi:acetolactate synthase regulatory subunit
VHHTFCGPPCGSILSKTKPLAALRYGQAALREHATGLADGMNPMAPVRISFVVQAVYEGIDRVLAQVRRAGFEISTIRVWKRRDGAYVVQIEIHSAPMDRVDVLADRVRAIIGLSDLTVGQVAHRGGGAPEPLMDFSTSR